MRRGVEQAQLRSSLANLDMQVDKQTSQHTNVILFLKASRRPPRPGRKQTAGDLKPPGEGRNRGGKKGWGVPGRGAGGGGRKGRERKGGDFYRQPTPIQEGETSPQNLEPHLWVHTDEPPPPPPMTTRSAGNLSGAQANLKHDVVVPDVFRTVGLSGGGCGLR